MLCCTPCAQTYIAGTIALHGFSSNFYQLVPMKLSLLCSHPVWSYPFSMLVPWIRVDGGGNDDLCTDLCCRKSLWWKKSQVYLRLDRTLSPSYCWRRSAGVALSSRLLRLMYIFLLSALISYNCLGPCYPPIKLWVLLCNLEDALRCQKRLAVKYY